MKRRPKTRDPLPEDLLVGRRIRDLRTTLSMTQTDLGARVGVSFQQIQKYEGGLDRISVGRLVRIARAFGVPVARFFDTIEVQHG